VATVVGTVALDAAQQRDLASGDMATRELVHEALTGKGATRPDVLRAQVHDAEEGAAMDRDAIARQAHEAVFGVVPDQSAMLAYEVDAAVPSGMLELSSGTCTAGSPGMPLGPPPPIN